MAKRTYRVKKGDNYSNLGYDPQVLMNLNPGVPKLSTGQTIFVPSSIGAGYQTRTAAYGGSYNPTVPAPISTTTHGYRSQPRTTAPAPSGFQPVVDVYSNMTPQNLVNAFVDPFRPTPVGTSRRGRKPSSMEVQTGAGLVGTVNPYQNLGLYSNSPYIGFQTPTTSGFLASQANPVSSVSGFQTPTTNGFLASPNYPATSYMNPALTAPTPPLTAPTVSKAEGRAQFLSGNGINPDSGYIPTRADVWNMKANQRRRRQAKTAGDEVGGGGGGQIVRPLRNQGNMVNSATSWRVG